MRKLSTLLGVLMVIAAAGVAGAATGAYIKFEGLDGESRDKDHQGWIDVASLSAPALKPGAGTSASRRTGDVVLEDIQMAKPADKASPKLAEAVCKGRVFPRVELHVPSSGTGAPTYSVYELKNVRVTSYSVRGAGSGSSGPLPMEQLSLSFEAMSQNMASSKSKGKVEASWKVEEGVK